MQSARIASLAVTAIALAGAAQASPVRDPVHAYRVAHEKQVVTDFVTLLAMPNVATVVPDVEKNATYIKGQLEARGFRTQLLTAEPGYDDNQHAQNENLRLGNLWDGIEVYAGLMADLNW